MHLFEVVSCIKTPVHPIQSVRIQLLTWPRPKSCSKTLETKLYTSTSLEIAKQLCEKKGPLLEQSLEAKYHCQSPSDWGSMRDLTSWGLNDPKKGEKSAQNYMGGAAQLPEKSGTTASKVTVGNTLRHHGLESCITRNVLLLKPAHVKARLKFANDHLDDPDESWENAMWTNETKIELFGHNSINRVWRKKNDDHPYCEAWRW